MKPKVSIIIPFYNCPYIAEAIQSALNQSYRNIEIIVVDDGSTSHADLITPYLPRIHYLGKANGGTASALNHGIRHASGEYIAWLSSDDMFYENKIYNQLFYMHRHKAVMSHTNFNYIDEHGQITQMNAGTIPMRRIELLRTFLQGNPVNGCTVMVRRDVLNRIGLFDESFPYTHDYDLWHRMLIARIHFSYLNQSLTAYRRHSGMGTLRHQPAIAAEIDVVRSRYGERLSRMIAGLSS